MNAAGAVAVGIASTASSILALGGLGALLGLSVRSALRRYAKDPRRWGVRLGRAWIILWVVALAAFLVGIETEPPDPLAIVGFVILAVVGVLNGSIGWLILRKA